MKFFTKHGILAALSLGFSMAASAGAIYVVGDAPECGWSDWDAIAIASTEANENIFEGTVYLKADKDFKFLTVPRWDNDEYGAVENTALVDGKVKLAGGRQDNGYSKIQVSETANYLITVNLDEMEASIVKSDYQETPINVAYLGLVGSATSGEWNIDNATPLVQNNDKPYLFSGDLALNEGTFKITKSPYNNENNEGWEQRLWYFRDADDAGKMVPDQAGDIQWSIDAAGKYNIEANTLENTIKIEKANTTAINDIELVGETPAQYFNLQGIPVNNPEKGVFVRVINGKATKVILK